MNTEQRNILEQNIDEIKQIINNYNALGILNREAVIHKIQSFKAEVDNTGINLDTISGGSVLLEKASDEQIVNELKKLLSVLRSKLYLG